MMRASPYPTLDVEMPGVDSEQQSPHIWAMEAGVSLVRTSVRPLLDVGLEMLVNLGPLGSLQHCATGTVPSPPKHIITEQKH